MTALTLPFAKKSTPSKAGFDLGPAARALVSIACFTMSFLVIIALGE